MRSFMLQRFYASCDARDAEITQSANHYSEHKTVVSLAADRLQHSGTQAWLGGYKFGEVTHALDIWIGIFRLDDFAVAYHVIGYDDGSRTRQLQRPIQIFRVASLVRIDEDQIEG